MIRVDGYVYTWMGDPIYPSGPPSVTQQSFEYTSTKSIFTMNVNNAVQMVITFLSPVTPNDIARSSFPVTYMNVAINSIDGANHTVTLYTDITSGKSAKAAREPLLTSDYRVGDGRPCCSDPVVLQYNGYEQTRLSSRLEAAAARLFRIV